MPLRPTSKTQLSGYRFLQRRARLAVVGRDVRMLHDPVRRQSISLAAGIGVAVLVLAGCVILALLKPAPDVSRATIMTGADGSGLYVRIGSTVHPVLNLASARLIVGRPDETAVVRGQDLARAPRGPQLGIPGAPGSLPGPRDPAQAAAIAWTVCDESGQGARPGPSRTTVTAAERENRRGTAGREEGVRTTSSDEIVLAETEGTGTGWLLRDGTRSRVDLGDTRLLEIFGLQSVTPRRVSAALLDTLVEVGPVVRPVIPGAGAPVGYVLPGVHVGQVISVMTATGEVFYVALSDGIQQVGPALADLVRATVTIGDVARVSPDSLGVPRSTALDAAPYPPRRPTALETGPEPVLCTRWSTDVSGSEATTLLLTGSRVPGGRTPVELARADGPGPAVDAVSVPGGGLLVTGVGRGPGASPRGGVLGVLADTGVRFDLADAEAASALGMTGTPVATPAGLLAALPSGPVLARVDALVQHDGMRPDPVPGHERVATGPGG